MDKSKVLRPHFHFCLFSCLFTVCLRLLLDCGQGKVAADTSDCYLDFHKLTLHLQGDKEWVTMLSPAASRAGLLLGTVTMYCLSDRSAWRQCFSVVDQTKLPEKALHRLHHLHRQNGHQGSGESSRAGWRYLVALDVRYRRDTMMCSDSRRADL